MIEIDVLKTLQKHDPDGKRGCVRMKDWFDYRGHVCMVFEKLGLSLYDFLRKNHYHGFSLEMVRDFGIQLLEAVACKCICTRTSKLIRMFTDMSCLLV